MNVLWIIEPLKELNNFDDEIDKSIKRLYNSVISLGYNVEYHSYDYSKKQNFDFLNNDGKVIFQGSINFARQLRSMKPNCKPLLYLTEENYRFLTWDKHLKNYMLNDEYVSLNAYFVENQLNNIRKKFGEEFFVRPDSGMKPFSGSKVNFEDFSYTWQFLSTLINPHENIIFAPIKNISQEYRFFICGYEMITGCKYIENNELELDVNVPDEVINYLNEVLNYMKKIDWKPDDVYVCDIVRLNDESLKVIEFNSFSLAGLYACDTDKIVKVVSEL